MRDFATYLIIGSLGVVTSTVMTVGGLGLTIASVPMPGHDNFIQHVDRTHKGDRLDLRGNITNRLEPKQPSVMPIGCEPEFSALTNPRHANISSRCVA